MIYKVYARRVCRLVLITLLAIAAIDSVARVGQAQENSASPSISRVAPQKCLFYTEWQPAPPPKNGELSETEKLMQEAEVKQFLSHLQKMIVEAAPLSVADGDRATRSAIQRLTEKMIESATSKSGAVLVENLGMDFINQRFMLDAAIVLEMDGNKSGIQNAFAALLKKGELEFEKVSINEVEFLEVTWPAEASLASKMYFGGTDQYFLIGSGKSTVRKCLQRLSANEVPEWVSEIRKRQNVARPFGLTYVNLKLILDQYLPLAGEETVAIAETLGVNSIGVIESVTGYDQKGIITKSSLQLQGDARGLLKIFDGRPINAKMLSNLPADSFVAGAVAIDPESIMNLVREMIAESVPNAQQEFENSLEMFKVDFGFDLEELAANIGPTVVIVNGAGDGWLTGMTMRVEVADQKVVESSLRKLIVLMQNSALQWNLDIGIEQETFNGHKIYYARSKNGPFLFEPAWTFVNNQLVFALTRSTLRPLIENSSQDEKLKPTDILISTGGTNKKLLATFYVDDRRQFEFIYPYLLIMKAMMPQMMSEFGPGDESAQEFAAKIAAVPLPSARSIHRHLRPSVINVFRSDTGVDMVVRQTVPSPNLAVASPIGIALLLPAVQAARQAARRTQSANNLKMQMLAAHIHHDVHKRFPASYSVDKDGKPLLSWRVHLLPYLEHQNLYDQFRLDEPWDSEHNRRLIAKMPEVYRSPASQAVDGKTVYRGIGGLNGTFRPPARPGTHVGNKMATFLDGLSNTATIFETSDNLAIEWTKPEVLIPGKFKLTDLFGSYPGGTNAALADGSVHFISDAATPRLLKALFTKNDGEAIDPLLQLERLESLRRNDPRAYQKQYEQESAELKKQEELEEQVQKYRTELSMVYAKLERIQSQLNSQSRAVDALQAQTNQLKKQYVDNPSDELASEIEKTFAKFTAGNKQLLELRKQMQILQLKKKSASTFLERMETELYSR